MKVEAITTLNIDGQTYNVSDLSDNLQKLVSLLDTCRQEDADLRDELTLVQYTQRALSQDLVAGIQAAATQAAADAAIAATAAATTAPDAVAPTDPTVPVAPVTAPAPVDTSAPAATNGGV